MGLAGCEGMAAAAAVAAVAHTRPTDPLAGVADVAAGSQRTTVLRHTAELAVVAAEQRNPFGCTAALEVVAQIAAAILDLALVWS